MANLTVGRVTAVKYKGKLLALRSDGTKDKIYLRDTKSNSTLINMRSRRRMPVTPRPRRRLQQGQAQMAGQLFLTTMEGADGHHIEVQQFGGFGPMGVNALGDW